MNSDGTEMFIVKAGTLEVWLTAGAEPVRLAFMQAGQVLEGKARSAELRAGPQGVQLLALTQAALTTLAEEDPAMGMRMMQNLAISLGKRLRHQNWRAARAVEIDITPVK